MKSRIWSFLLPLLLFCSCASTVASLDLNFSEMKGDDGYVYPGLPWGMAIEEVEKAVGTTFVDGNGKAKPESGQPAFAERESVILYPATEAKRYIEFCGGRGEVSYQFFTGGLASVGVTYVKGSNAKPKNEDLAKLHTEMLGRLTEVLGEPTDDQTEEFTFGRSTTTDRICEWSWESAKIPGQTTFVRLVTSIPEGKSEPGSLEFNISRFVKKPD